MRKGFTIIELIVVLGIIALLAAISLVFLMPSSAKGRDSRREEDIKSIQSALSLYINQKNVYPVCAQETAVDGNTDCLSSLLLSEGTIKVMPLDPKYKGMGSCGGADSFLYCYQSADGTSYTIRYPLETNSVQGKSAGWQSVNP
ncbi:MAG: type II secretion system protein [Candidatus Giovannonibacteria bacterium]|nr:type II secretion system protein [Candidatus Giovannonibacteria bacterium]